MTPRRYAHDAARLAFAAVGVAAIAYMVAYLKATPGAHFRPGNFFSFFTVQTNLFAVATLCAAVVVRREERGRLFDAVRGAVTLYISITGVVFALLLAGRQEQLDAHVAWVDFTLHKLVPVVLVLDWLLEPARHELPLWIAGAWLVYPLAWFAYTLARGPSAGWYPYPFVDVAAHGYGRVLLNAVVLAVAFAVGALGFVLLGNRRARPSMGRDERPATAR
jgi:hypothetical protein